SQSGAGKSSMAELVETMTPSEDVVAFARLSPQALMYEKKDFLKHRLLILEERVGAEQADYSIRVLQSRSKVSQATVVTNALTGERHTEHYEVEGPIAYIETTTDHKINAENASRAFEIFLDESPEQTQRIHELQRKRRLEGWQHHSKESIFHRHHNAQRLLEPLAVRYAFCELINFPTRWLRTRRDHARFLSLIDTVAFLHQHQRERGSENVDGQEQPIIRATLDDYRVAYRLA